MIRGGFKTKSDGIFHSMTFERRKERKGGWREGGGGIDGQTRWSRYGYGE